MVFITPLQEILVYNNQLVFTINLTLLQKCVLMNALVLLFSINFYIPCYCMCVFILQLLFFIIYLLFVFSFTLCKCHSTKAVSLLNVDCEYILESTKHAVDTAMGCV